VDLCAILEAVFSHGLKRNRSLLKITKNIATKGLTRASVAGDTVTFWLFVVQFLNKHDHERYLVLKNVHMGMSEQTSHIQYDAAILSGNWLDRISLLTPFS
jgi:hypothetical protein